MAIILVTIRLEPEITKKTSSLISSSYHWSTGIWFQLTNLNKYEGCSSSNIKDINSVVHIKA